MAAIGPPFLIKRFPGWYRDSLQQERLGEVREGEMTLTPGRLNHRTSSVMPRPCRRLASSEPRVLRVVVLPGLLILSRRAVWVWEGVWVFLA